MHQWQVRDEHKWSHLAAQLLLGSMTVMSDWKFGVVQSATRSRSPSIPKNGQFSQPLP